MPRVGMLVGWLMTPSCCWMRSASQQQLHWQFFRSKESGKITILDELAYAPETADRDKIWAKYRKHKSKNVVWFIPCVFVKGRVDQDGFRLVAENYAKISARLDQYKQSSLYTGYLGNGNWSEPEKAMDLQLASLLVEIADQLAFEHTVTVKEIELRIEHLRPAYGASPEVWMKANKNFMVALFDNGLLGRRQHFGRRICNCSWRGKYCCESFDGIYNARIGGGDPCRLTSSRPAAR